MGWTIVGEASNSIRRTLNKLSNEAFQGCSTERALRRKIGKLRAVPHEHCGQGEVPNGFQSVSFVRTPAWPVVGLGGGGRSLVVGAL